MFLDDEMLLTTPTAKTLFHDYAETLPIVDYHCHLNPSEIASDAQFSGIVEAWLGGDNYGDHYKWRLMRANGAPEELVTGNGSDWDKFDAFAGAIERAIGNPVYLWTHLELKRIFGIDTELTRSSARRIFDETNELLAAPEFSRRNLIRRFNVDVVCTTDDPADTLEYHTQLASDSTFQVVPALRPDKALNPQSADFGPWIARLEAVSGRSIHSFADLTEAIASRVDYFSEFGSRLSDHAVDVVEYSPATPSELNAIVSKARDGFEALTPYEISQYRTALFIELMQIYYDRDWTMQWHIHAARNLNTRGFQRHGADTGFDAMNDHSIVDPLAALLDQAAKKDAVPRSILYSLNPTDWLPIATLMGTYQGGAEQKFQLGNAWWFNDTRSGIRAQLTTMAEQSLIGNFIGMTTDSRSFLSYPRHEFFRRIFCELLGEWAERGEITNDTEALGTIVRRVCYENARSYFPAAAGASSAPTPAQPVGAVS